MTFETGKLALLANGAVTASDENDNIFYWSTPQITKSASSSPDLIVQNYSATPTTVAQGGSISLSAQVKNQGTGSAASSYLGYYISTNNVWSTGDTYLGNDYVTSLSANNFS